MFISLLLTLVLSAEGQEDSLKSVRAYADAMVAHSQGSPPLFAETLDRQTMRLLEGPLLKKAAAMGYDEWGIRAHDRMLNGANPQHDQNLYQILYALTQVTGNPKYAAAADRSLKFFLESCQAPATGLYYWGEHAGWDLSTNRPGKYSSGDTHEFFRPWVLWDKCWKLAPDSCRRFAQGLWEHQIGDHQTGAYSRHAAISKHGPGTTAPYPRHGGMYLETWAKAYAQTKDPLFLKAVETLVDGLEENRRNGGLTTSRNRDPQQPSGILFDVSLAISLGEAAPLLPEPAAGKLRDIAAQHDAEYTKAKTTNPLKIAPDANLWSDGYGGAGGEIASQACTAMVRYRQVGGGAYRQTVLDSAAAYLDRDIQLSFPIYPGTLGKVILLMLNAHQLSGEAKYLDRAGKLAVQSATLFLNGSPLPKATHLHNHYEAITMGDTLMMALLQLWAVRQKPPIKLSLIFNDR